MKKNVMKTLSIVFILTVISKVLGLLRDIVFARYYGTGMEATAYFTSIKIPTQIVDIVLSSSIVSVFIPVFNELLQKNGKDVANKFANNFINIIAIISTLISIIGIIFAPQIVSVIASGFDEPTHLLTTELIRITFPMIIFTALAFSFVGLLQSYGEFNVPAGISALSNLVIILFLILFSSKTGIHGVAYAMVFAWALQLLIQLPFAKKFGYKFSFKTNFRDENLKKVFKLSIPILISTAVLPINNLVSLNFASGMGESSVSALEYAYKLYVVIYGIFSYAVGNIIFPSLSREGAKEDKEEYKGIINRSVKLLSFLLIPLTFGIIIYSKDIIKIIYEHGEFTAESTMLTSQALLFYAIGIFGAGLVEIMNKSFYARQDTKTPLFVGTGMIIINYFLCYLLGNTSLNYGGLALATALVTIINALVLYIIQNIKIKGLLTKDNLIHLSKIVISTLLMSLLVIVFNKYAVNINDYLRVIVGAGIGIITYFVVTLLLKVNEFRFEKN